MKRMLTKLYRSNGADAGQVEVSSMHGWKNETKIHNMSQEAKMAYQTESEIMSNLFVQTKIKINKLVSISKVPVFPSIWIKITQQVLCSFRESAGILVS